MGTMATIWKFVLFTTKGLFTERILSDLEHQISPCPCHSEQLCPKFKTYACCNQSVVRFDYANKKIFSSFFSKLGWSLGLFFFA